MDPHVVRVRHKLLNNLLHEALDTHRDTHGHTGTHTRPTQGHRSCQHLAFSGWLVVLQEMSARRGGGSFLGLQFCDGMHVPCCTVSSASILLYTIQ